MSAKDLSVNEKRMLNGQLYFAFDEQLVARRKKCKYVCRMFNDADDVPRRRVIELWRQEAGECLVPRSPSEDEDKLKVFRWTTPNGFMRNNSVNAPSIVQVYVIWITCNFTPLPAPASTSEEDDALFDSEPWVEAPFTADYGFNFHVGRNVFINFNCIVLDTCEVRIGDRTVIGPNVSFYSATHPVDPGLRDGLEGPELGKGIDVGSDCWFGGSVIILPGVKIGKGCTVGAGSVVTKDVPDYSVVAGNPAKIIRRLKASEMTEPHGSLPKKTKEEIILDDDEAPLPDKS